MLATPELARGGEMEGVAVLGLVAACSMRAGTLHDGPDANAGSDGNPGCGIGIIFAPPYPIASPTLPIRAYTDVVNVGGVLTYTWDVRTSAGTVVKVTQAASDFSQINFLAPNPGPY